jgi:hypothetical protein
MKIAINKEMICTTQTIYFLINIISPTTTAMNKMSPWMAPLHHGRPSRLQGRSRRNRVTWRLPALVPSRLKNNDTIACPYLSCLPLRYLLWTEPETNIPKLRAVIRGLALCLGADLNSRFDPSYYIKVLEGAHGQLFVKLDNILRNHQPTWASLIESLTHEPRPTSSSFLSRKAALVLKPQNKPGQTRASPCICGSLDLRSLADL